MATSRRRDGSERAPWRRGRNQVSRARARFRYANVFLRQAARPPLARTPGRADRYFSPGETLKRECSDLLLLLLRLLDWRGGLQSVSHCGLRADVARANRKTHATDGQSKALRALPLALLLGRVDNLRRRRRLGRRRARLGLLRRLALCGTLLGRWCGRRRRLSTRPRLGRSWLGLLNVGL